MRRGRKKRTTQPCTQLLNSRGSSNKFNLIHQLQSDIGDKRMLNTFGLIPTFWGKHFGQNCGNKHQPKWQHSDRHYQYYCNSKMVEPFWLSYDLIQCISKNSLNKMYFHAQPKRFNSNVLLSKNEHSQFWWTGEWLSTRFTAISSVRRKALSITSVISFSIADMLMMIWKYFVTCRCCSRIHHQKHVQNSLNRRIERIFVSLEAFHIISFSTHRECPFCVECIHTYPSFAHLAFWSSSNFGLKCFLFYL